MNIKEKLMDLIGVAVMTNKDLLLMELDKLDGKTFEHMILSNMSDLPKLVEFVHCEDCKAQHGGVCINPGDDACTYTTAKWLESPCIRDHILTPGEPC